MLIVLLKLDHMQPVSTHDEPSLTEELRGRMKRNRKAALKTIRYANRRCWLLWQMPFIPKTFQTVTQPIKYYLHLITSDPASTDN